VLKNCACKWFTLTWDLHAEYTTMDTYMLEHWHVVHIH
jgi:hypothetical protein